MTEQSRPLRGRGAEYKETQEKGKKLLSYVHRFVEMQFQRDWMIRKMCDGLQSVRKPGQTILVFNCVYGSAIGAFGLKNASIER